MGAINTKGQPSTKVAAALAEALPTLAGEGKKDFVALLAADADGSAPLEGVDVEAAKAAAEAAPGDDGFYAADALAKLGAWAAALAALWDLVKAQKQAADEAEAAAEAEDD